MVRPSERIENIYGLLAEKPRSLTEIVKLTGMHYATVQEYIDMIIDIQQRPRVEKITTGRTTIVRIQAPWPEKRVDGPKWVKRVWWTQLASFKPFVSDSEVENNPKSVVAEYLQFCLQTLIRRVPSYIFSARISH